MEKILIVDDERSMRDVLSIMLKRAGYEIAVASDGVEAIARIEKELFDLVITDLKMPTKGGLDVLKAVKDTSPDSVVLIVTAFASTESAVEAMKLGAYDYLPKPFQVDEVQLKIRNALGSRRLSTENMLLKREVAAKTSQARLIGKSDAMQKVLDVIKKVADTKSNVLICGESGTGKELVARAIHANSARARMPFVPVNCSALPETLLESELFGYMKGAFTGAATNKAGLFEVANGGSIFLDEIGETTPATQVKLLRVLQHREVIPVGATDAEPIDVRLIAATNRNLEESIRRGSFRQDLFYRLNVITIHLPPLRDRRDDIPLLAEAFLRRNEPRGEQHVKRLSEATLEVLGGYTWPGNVRELENALERAIILTPGEVIEPDSLPERVRERRAEPLVSERVQVNPTLDAIERAYILWVLQGEDGNKTRAAEVLGIDPSTLHRKLARYGLDT